MKILVTGAAGFIGFHVVREIFKMYPKAKVTGLDNLNAYYSPGLKKDRLALLKGRNFNFVRADVCDARFIQNLCAKERFDYIVHLAAQAGVNYSLKNPHAYVDANISGFLNILEACRAGGVKHLVYASSSSVYGLSKKTPFSERDATDKPASFYAVTKKTNEAMAFAYGHMFNVKSTGARLFTVYGPWYRPDMALSIFARKILAGEKIELFNSGRMKRDFTFIDDAARALTTLITRVPEQPEIFNIASARPVGLRAALKTLEKCLCKKADIIYSPLRPGDVLNTQADIKKLKKATGFTPKTTFKKGIEKFAAWHREYYKL